MGAQGSTPWKQTIKRGVTAFSLRNNTHAEPAQISNLGVAPSPKFGNLQTLALNRSSALRLLPSPSNLASFERWKSPASDGGGQNHQWPDEPNLHGHKDHRLERASPFSDFFQLVSYSQLTVHYSFTSLKNILIIQKSHDSQILINKKIMTTCIFYPHFR